MCWKNVMIWKKSKIPITNKRSDYIRNNVILLFEVNKNSGVVKTKNGRMILFSKCSVCNSNKSKFLKEQKARGILSSIGIKIPLSQIPFVRSYFVLKCKMNETINKFILAGETFMLEMHFRQPAFMYSDCDPFT